MFILSNDKGKYICEDTFTQNGSMHKKYGITTDRNKAILYNEMNKAENVKNNCLNRSLRSMGFKVVQIKEQVISDSEKENIKPVNEETFSENLIGILNDITHIDSLVSDVQDKKNILFYALKTVDREISDIHHWIEFNKFNACEGYKAFALLKEKLSHRRDIKNGIEVLKAVSNVEETVIALKNRNYRPRELDELFQGDSYE